MFAAKLASCTLELELASSWQVGSTETAATLEDLVSNNKKLRESSCEAPNEPSQQLCSPNGPSPPTPSMQRVLFLKARSPRLLAHPLALLRLPVTTSVASPTAPLTAILPSQVPLPPVQAWCPSEIFCAGAVCHVFFSRSDSSAYLILYSSCKPSTSPSSGRTQKPLSTSPQAQALSLSLLHLRPSTLPIPPRAPCLTL
jgi:hypothetical protein